MDKPPSYQSLGTAPDEPPLYSSLDVSDFKEDKYRKSFITKVYTILMVQLSVTALVAGLFMNNASINEWVNANMNEIYIPLIIILFILIIMIGCIGTLRKTAPWNYIILALVTLLMSFLVGFAAAQHQTNIVLMAALFTIGITLSLTIFAWSSKYDFTSWHPYMFVILVVVILFGIIGGIFHDQIVNVAYSALIALIFSIYLVIDTQSIIGGNHRYQFAPDEYIIGALALYLDIINIFLALLGLSDSK